MSLTDSNYVTLDLSLSLQGIEFIRVASGAGSHTRDMPARITDYVPTESDVGGWWDDSVSAFIHTFNEWSS